MARIVVPPIQIETCFIALKGLSPLIVHKWSEKAKKEMLDKQTKKATGGKKAKDPEQDFADSLYVLDEGRYGFPSIGFKLAAVRAGKQVDIAMTDCRQAFHIVGEFAVIDGTPTMREDMVRLNGLTADIRHRGEFKEWTTTLEVQYSPSMISEEQLRNLFQIAGFSVGVGEWRPERDGPYGRFELA